MGKKRYELYNMCDIFLKALLCKLWISQAFTFSTRVGGGTITNYYGLQRKQMISRFKKKLYTCITVRWVLIFHKAVRKAIETMIYDEDKWLEQLEAAHFHPTWLFVC